MANSNLRQAHLTIKNEEEEMKKSCKPKVSPDISSQSIMILDTASGEGTPQTETLQI